MNDKWSSRSLCFGKSACGRRILAVLLISLAMTGVTTAYLTYHRMLVNQIGIGTNTISIIEEFVPLKKQDLGDNVFKKKVQIKNTDKTDSFIRVFMNFSDSAVKDLSKMSPGGNDWYDASEYMSSDFSNLPGNWVYVSEEEDGLLGGFYYYTIPVKAGELTVPLVERIMVTYTDASQIQDFDILVTADSIQTYVNEESEDGSFTAKDVSEEADGWKTAWTQYMERR